MYTTIFFDLGNVILEIFPKKMCQNVGQYTGLGEETIMKLFFEDKIFDLYESGKLTTEQLCVHLSTLAKHKLCPEKLKHMLSHENSIPRPKMVQLLSTLKEQKVELIALSNTNEAHFHFNRDTGGFIHHFDALVLSYEVGALKPDPKIYAHALASASSPAHKCFFIDDLAENIEGAQKAGIQGHHFTGHDSLHKQLRSFNLI